MRIATFAALGLPNYRLWFFGQMVSLFGTWMQSTAQGYLVFELTRSSAWLGYTGFAAGIASLGGFRGRGRLLSAGSIVFPVVLAGLSFTRSLPLTLAALFFAGAALISMFNLANVLVQTLVPDAVRGRVMSVYNLAFLGMAPIGALAIGAAAGRFGEPTALLAFALVSLACTAGIALAVPSLRRIP